MKKAAALMAVMSMLTGVIPVNAASLAERQVSTATDERYDKL